jgi:hypothetical protein
MNKYKVEIKEVLKKEIILEAETPKDALDFLEKVYFKSNILTFDDRDIETVETEVLEENGEKIKEKYENFEEENSENEELYETDLEEIDARLDDIDDILFEIKNSENYIDDKMNFMKEITENTAKNLEEFNENFEQTIIPNFIEICEKTVKNAKKKTTKKATKTSKK